MKRKYVLILKNYKKNEKKPLFFRCFDNQGYALFSERFCTFEKDDAKLIKAQCTLALSVFSYFVDDELD